MPFIFIKLHQFKIIWYLMHHRQVLNCAWPLRNKVKMIIYIKHFIEYDYQGLIIIIIQLLIFNSSIFLDRANFNSSDYVPTLCSESPSSQMDTFASDKIEGVDSQSAKRVSIHKISLVTYTGFLPQFPF